MRGAHLSAISLLVAGLAKWGASQTYHVTSLATVDGLYSQGTAINKYGEAVGYMGIPVSEGQTAITHAFKYTGGVTQDLGSLPGINDMSAAFAINDLGAVTGYDETDRFLGFVSHNGSMKPLDIWGGGTTMAMGINNSGEIVGSADSPISDLHAYRLSNGIAGDLGTLGGPASFANGINNSGDVVGWAYLDNYTAHAFLYNAKGMNDLGTLSGNGWDSSNATAINDAGQVVGYSGYRAFLYSKGVMRALPTYDDRKMEAYGINSQGDVVGGIVGNGYYGNDPFLYTGGNLLNLNQHLDETNHWHVEVVRGINDSGMIVGTAVEHSSGRLTAVILTPVPEPATALVLAAGLALVANRRNRQA